jgi:integrase
MIRASLMGSHTHTSTCGIAVHIWQRGPQFLARGRLRGCQFGQCLGATEEAAKAQLRRLLTELDEGRYVAPSEARKRLLGNGQVPRLTLRDLVNEFLSERRKIRGKRTAGTYRSRLLPVLDFAEQNRAKKRWPLAASIDRDFVVDLRSFLNQLTATPNGRPGAASKLVSQRQIRNVLETLRTVLAWAHRADIRKLPLDWSNPLLPEIIGPRPGKDPLRREIVPIDDRVKMVSVADRWQLGHLTLSLILPLRPGEAAGLLVSEVDLQKRWLKFGTRFEGADYTKGRTTFQIPFPAELRPILLACIGGRMEGPLLRNRGEFEQPSPNRHINSRGELERLVQQHLAHAHPEEIMSNNDKKQQVRRFLRELGAVNEDTLAKECEKLYAKAELPHGTALYDLRGSVTSTMKASGVPHLELTYITGHGTRDILNDYVGLDLDGAMGSYFLAIRPLLDAITQRALFLGISTQS